MPVTIPGEYRPVRRPDLVQSSVPATPKSRLLTFEQPATKVRLFVEISFYFLITFLSFSERLGYIGILNGAMILMLGVITFLLHFKQREQFPRSFFFMLFMNLTANFSLVIGYGETPIFGGGLSSLVHWTNLSLVTCYIVRNHKAQRRLLVFLCLLVLVTISVARAGDTRRPHQDPRLAYRLSLEDAGFGFRGTNGLAYVTSTLAIALLFHSLTSRLRGRILDWVLSLLLMTACMQTISRGGSIALAAGFLVFFIANLGGRHKLKNLVFMMSIGVFGVWILMSSQSFSFVRDRFQLKHDRSREERLGVYKVDPIGDLKRTWLWGTGHERAITSAGINAHNTFINTHMAFGGPTGYVYLLWLIYLGRRVWYLFTKRASREASLMLAALFGMMVICHFFSNMGFVYLSSFFAVAVIEKYTHHVHQRPQRT